MSVFTVLNAGAHSTECHLHAQSHTEDVKTHCFPLLRHVRRHPGCAAAPQQHVGSLSASAAIDWENVMHHPAQVAAHRAIKNRPCLSTGNGKCCISTTICCRASLLLPLLVPARISAVCLMAVKFQVLWSPLRQLPTAALTWQDRTHQVYVHL